MDSEDELAELIGEDANSENESYDSDALELERDAKGNDLELVNEGWIVDDDFVSDSSDTISLQEGENEAEYELRQQQR